MEKTTVTLEINIPPKYLSKNIERDLLGYLQTELKDYCSERTGYIKEILYPIKITNNYISRSTSMIIAQITFTAYVINPQIGMKIRGIVCMVLDDGIFIDIENDTLQILVPSTSENYIPKNEGDHVFVELTQIRYNNKQFSCIGKLVS